ncbi:hypothetical protein LCGC14_1027220 [marine sediment metagenome]|uniref:Uncharacterized protein n=1 Tax=marine sediment metagenome TaxID=412755 RepID=A0A0F9NHH9_9ZZZZ
MKDLIKIFVTTILKDFLVYLEQEKIKMFIAKEEMDSKSIIDDYIDNYNGE